MHYKNLAFAALAGIVLLSSCVKDLETKSVTDIRNAKLEEIKSQTALNNAKAASEKTLSEAEALLKAAQADAQKAQAEYIKAQAAYQQAVTEGVLMDNQLQAAQLEAALIQAEISKAKAQAELERLAMDLERQLLNAQAQLLQAQTNYESAKNSRLSSLANAYVNATITLLTAQNGLVQLKANLTSAEEDLVDLQTSKAQTIADNNEQIATYEKIVAACRENMGMTEEEVQAKLKELSTLIDESYVSHMTVSDLYADSEAKLNDARTSIYDYLIKNPFNLYFGSISAGSYNFGVNFYSSYSYGNGIYEYSYGYTDVDGNSVKIPFASKPSSEYEEDYYFDSIKDGKMVSLYYGNGLRTYGKTVILDPNAFANVAAAAKEVIAEQHKGDVANSQYYINRYSAMIDAFEKAISEYDAEIKPLYEEREELEKKSDEVYAAYQEAYKPYAEYLAAHWSELYSAQTTYNTAINLRWNLENEVNNLKSNINNLSSEFGQIRWAENNIAICTSDVANWTKEIETRTTAVKTAQEAYDAQFKVVAPLLTKKNEAYAAYREKQLAWYAGTLTDYTKVTEAETAYYTARDAWATEDATLQNLKDELDTAQGNLESANENLKICKQTLNEREIRLDNLKKDLAKAESDLAQKEPELEAAKDAQKAANDALNAAYNAIDENADKELYALYRAQSDAREKVTEANDLVYAVDGKIAEVEGTSKSVAYSYENAKGIPVNGRLTGNYSAYKSDLVDYKSYLKGCEDDLAYYNTSFEKFNKQVDEWLAKVTSIVESEAAYSADIDALNELENTTFALYKKSQDAFNAYLEVLNERSALNSEEGDIEYYLGLIENLKADNADITDITDKEDWIAELKVRIANKEAEVEVYKKIADEAKAALDAALAEENTTEE